MTRSRSSGASSSSSGSAPRILFQGTAGGGGFFPRARPRVPLRHGGALHEGGCGAERTSSAVFVHQTTLRLKSRPRGFHLVTAEILAGLPEVGRVRAGLLNLFLQHTSASLLINENADPDVRRDF